MLKMSDSLLIDRTDFHHGFGLDHDGGEDAHAQLGLLLLSTVVFGLGAGFFALWSGASLFSAFLAYMAGGWCGIGLAALTILRRSAAL